MSIEKYTTEAFVLAEYEQGEHDKTLKLFTKDFGVLFAVAKSVRKLESKMRYHLGVAKKVRVTLVRGKEVWRLVGIEGIENSSRQSAVICELVERFVRGEGTQKKLFDHASMFSVIAPQSFPEDVGMMTIYYVFLVDLGYADGLVSGASSMDEFFAFDVAQHFTHVTIRKELVKKHVHTVLSEMQL